MQLVSVMVVAAFLGPSEMARFALLLFLAGLVTQIASLLVKPGTIRRTFGGGDDEDDDDDEDDAASSSPPHTLGAGLAWAIVLGADRDGADLRLPRPDRRRPARRPRGREPGRARRACSPARCCVFKICDITLWLERRPGAFLIADTVAPAARPGRA